MTRHDEIRRSYKALGDVGNLYDGIITRSTLLRTRSRRSRRISPGACSRCRWARAC